MVADGNDAEHRTDCTERSGTVNDPASADILPAWRQGVGGDVAFRGVIGLGVVRHVVRGLSGEMCIDRGAEIRGRHASGADAA